MRSSRSLCYPVHQVYFLSLPFFSVFGRVSAGQVKIMGVCLSFTELDLKKMCFTLCAGENCHIGCDFANAEMFANMCLLLGVWQITFDFQCVISVFTKVHVCLPMLPNYLRFAEMFANLAITRSLSLSSQAHAAIKWEIKAKSRMMRCKFYNWML